MAEYVPIPFEEWKRANADLCREDPCGWCDGEGRLPEGECECAECGDQHEVKERDCPVCDGTGSLSLAEAHYRDRLQADREKWDAAMALRRTG